MESEALQVIDQIVTRGDFGEQIGNFRRAFLARLKEFVRHGREFNTREIREASFS
jgi:hypothetical protein